MQGLGRVQSEHIHRAQIMQISIRAILCQDENILDTGGCFHVLLDAKLIDSKDCTGETVSMT